MQTPLKVFFWYNDVTNLLSILLSRNPQSLCSEKNNKSIIFFSNRDIVSCTESCCGQGTAIQNKANREAFKKRIATLPKLDNECLNISLFCWDFSFPFNIKFYYKTFASTDIAVNHKCTTGEETCYFTPVRYL